MPRFKLEDGHFFVERPEMYDAYTAVSAVVYHAIFEDDLPLFCALALWNGPCLPCARGMMDCRQKMPCLVRAAAVSRFAGMARGFCASKTPTGGERALVAKWGDWHCGENKEKFSDRRRWDFPVLIEPFIDGEAVRVVAIGDLHWQIRMTGDNWLKSIHHQAAAFMPVDAQLLADTLALRRHFGLELVAVDYMVGTDGQRHLLEVNHIPNVTRFPEIREAYLAFACQWVKNIVR